MAREVNLKVGIDARKAGKGSTEFNRASNSIIKDANKVNSSFATLAKGTASLVTAFLGLKTIKLATDAFITQEKAVNQLNAVLKATKGISGKTSEELQNMAAALQQVTVFGDESIIEFQKLLLTFRNIRGEIFDRTIPAVLDLSTVLGTDLKSQAIQIGKALQDPVRGLVGLARSGVTFTDSQKETIKTLVESNQIMEAQKKILLELEAQTKGAAKAYKNTFGGALISLKNTFGDLLEQIVSTASKYTGAVAIIQNLEGKLIDTTKGIVDVKMEILQFAEGIKVVFNVLTETLTTTGRIIRATSSIIVKDITKSVKAAIDLVKNFSIGAFKTLGLFIDKTQGLFVQGIQNILGGLGSLVDFDGFGDLTFYIDQLGDSLDIFKSKTVFNDEMQKNIDEFMTNSNKALKVVGLDFKNLKKIVGLEFEVLSDTINKTFDDYEKKVKGVNFGIIDITKNSSDEQTKIVTDMLENQKKEYSDFQIFLQDGMLLTTDKIFEFGDNFTNTLTDSILEGKNKFKDFFSYVGRELLKMQLQQNIVTPLFSELNNTVFDPSYFLPGSTAATPTNTGIFQGPTNQPDFGPQLPNFSTSKIGLNFGSQRGLKPSINNNGSNITIINNTPAKIETRTSTGTNGQEQIEITVLNIVKAGFNNGEMNDTMQQFGIKQVN